MNAQTKKELKKLFPKAIFNEPLKKHCTFRIGGPADVFIEIEDPTQLIEYATKNTIPLIIIGGGSNVLFHDKGFRGIVIRLKPGPIKFAPPKTPKTLTAPAGTSLQTVIKKAQEKGFHNLSRLTGIPGTLGGAIRGNAGANGLEIKDVLKSATILNPKTGRIRTATPEQLKMKYRHSALKKTNEIVLKATLKLSKGKPIPKSLATNRTGTQPYGLSAGSFFKNPDHKNPKLSAGYLIEQCGLKGHEIGGTKISEKHANFIQNLNDTSSPVTQKDVLRLAALAKQKVYKKFKITLEEEVQIIPEKPKKST
jgi:UDP-N-acetylmuramate dehydrogenase